MCYERTKIKICQVFFNISNSLCFFSPAILDLDSNFPSTHYWPCISIYSILTCARRVSCIMGVYGWSKLHGCNNTKAGTYYKHYIHDTHAVSDYVLLLHNKKFSMPLRLTIQCQLNKTLLMYLQLIIVYLIVIICSQ